MATGRLSLI
jgi:hypothetical protein